MAYKGLTPFKVELALEISTLWLLKSDSRLWYWFIRFVIKVLIKLAQFASENTWPWTCENNVFFKPQKNGTMKTASLAEIAYMCPQLMKSELALEDHLLLEENASERCTRYCCSERSFHPSEYILYILQKPDLHRGALHSSLTLQTVKREKTAKSSLKYSAVIVLACNSCLCCRHLTRPTHVVDHSYW